MDLDGRRTSYSIARVLEEVQEQKTKEEQLRLSWLGDQLPPASAEVNSQSDTAPNAQEELAFKPGFVNQLLGKFGGSTASSGGRLRKAASAQNLAATASPGATPSGVLLRHPSKISSVSVGSGGGSGGGVRRRSQDGVANGHALVSPSNTSSPSPSLASSASTPTFPSSVTSKLPSSSSTVDGGGGGRVFIIPKASTPPVVKRLQQQSQQQRNQQQQSEQQQKPVAAPPATVESPAEASKSFVPIPSDESLPIKNMVQAKRSLFEQSQQAPNRSKIDSNGNDAGLSTVSKPISPKPVQPQYVKGGGHQPVIGRASPSAGTTRQIVPRPTVEIRSAAAPSVPTSKPLPTSPLKPHTPASPSPVKASATAILPPRPVVTFAVAPSKRPPALGQPENGSSSDGYGFGLPVPRLKTSLPFNGEVTKKVELSERAVTAMRKAGKSWFFGTDVAAAPEGTIAVKLTPNNRPFSLTDEDEASGSYVIDDGLTEERRAQTTVWDHVRNADSGQQRVDPGLAAEARRLMASANASGEGEEADASSATSARRGIADGAAAVAARNRNRKLCFKRDSVLEETFEYQSEQSLIDELQITPDYPTGPFELSEEPVQQDEEEEETARKQAAPIPTAGGATVATYKTKATDDFVWGATRPSSVVKETASSPTAKSNDVEDDTTDSAGAVDDSDAQWSSSATTDLLF